MVEFALVVLFAFLPMIFGTIELGRGVWHYHQLSQLSREGARWLIVTTAASKTTTGPDVKQSFHTNGNHPTHPPYVVSPTPYVLGTCNCPGTAVGHMASLENGLDENAVTVTITQHTGEHVTNQDRYPRYIHGARVTVAVNYPYQPLLTSFLRIPGQINLKSETSMRLQ